MSKNSQPNGGQRELAIKFKVLKFLGKGSYGSVFQVQRLNDNQTYALKEMDVRSMSQVEREDSVNEIRLLASVQHMNVISYNEAFLDGNRLCIIMEYAPDGDLARVIKKQQMLKRPLPEEQIWKFFIQIAMGLQALHNMRILHRDIKPGNIMIGDDGVVKIGDLGIAKLLTKTLAAKTQIGTPHYMPPEIWRNKPYSFSSDSWALGCLLYEMATCSVPFEARSMSELRYKVLKGSYTPISANTFSKELIQMCKDCLDQNPDRRPNMDSILSSAAVAARLHSLPGDLGRAPPSTAGSQLYNTIKVPKNFSLIKNKLPPPQYPSDMMNAIGEEYDDEGVEILDVQKFQTPSYPSTRPAAPVKAYHSPLPGVNNHREQAQRQPNNQKLQSSVSALPALYSFIPSQPPSPPHPQLNGSRPLAPLQNHGSPIMGNDAQGDGHAHGGGIPTVSESHAKYGAFYHAGSSPTPVPASHTPIWHQPLSPYMQQRQAELAVQRQHEHQRQNQIQQQHSSNEQRNQFQQPPQQQQSGEGQNLPALGAFDRRGEQVTQHQAQMQQQQQAYQQQYQQQRQQQQAPEQLQRQQQQQRQQQKDLMYGVAYLPGAPKSVIAQHSKLPSITQQQAQVHQQQQHQQQQQHVQMHRANSKPPPWNYGVRSKAAALAAAREAAAASRALLNLVQDGNNPSTGAAAAAAAGNISRYPPPQWQASRPW